MRILLCVSDLTKGRGGAERVAAEMAAEMCRRGHDVAIYSDAESDEESAYPLHPDIIHLKHPLRRGNNLATAREIIREFKPDVGFIFYYNIKLIPLFALLEPLNIPIGLQECTNPSFLSIKRKRRIYFRIINLFGSMTVSCSFLI